MMTVLEKLGSGLKNRIVVYVPSTVNVNVMIDNGKYVRYVMEELSKLFGGATAYDALGSWLSDDVGLVTENVKLVYSFTDELDNQKLEKVVELCEWIKREMSQECVSLEVNGQLYFV